MVIFVYIISRKFCKMSMVFHREKIFFLDLVTCLRIVQGSPFPLMLDSDTSSLMDLGIGNDSIILVDEEGS